MKRSSYSKRIGYPTNMRWITFVFYITIYVQMSVVLIIIVKRVD